VMERKNTQLPKFSIMNLLEQRTLGLGEIHGDRAFCVVIGDTVDPRADGIAPHGASQGFNISDTALTFVIPGSSHRS
jgi:hypothetical protein